MFDTAAQLLHALRTKNAAFWKKVGEERTLQLFHAVADRVPAYGDFLRKHHITPERIQTIQDFQYVPVIDKDNYIRAYPLDALCWDGVLGSGTTIATSSGTTGVPSFWPRQYRHEIAVTMIHDALFREYYDVEKRTTLFVVCFHLGAHIAGMVTVSAIRDMLATGLHGSLISPGLNTDDIIRIIQELGGRYDQVVLVGYPPFLKDIVTRGQKVVTGWENMKIRFLFAAEAFSEPWRRYVAEQVHTLSDEYMGFNIYGSADIGLMAHETPLSIDIRNLMTQRAITDSSAPAQVPALFQYHPWFRYFESVFGELCCSGDAGIPLIRYNMKDRGEVFEYADGRAMCPESLQTSWQLPFVSVFGRSNHTVTLYGLNIYPEHVSQALTVESFLRTVSGRFFLKQVFDATQDQYVEVHVELHDGVVPHESIVTALVDHLVSHMRRVNQEYKKLHEAIGERAVFRVQVYEYRSPAFTTVAAKHKYIVRTP